MQHRFEKTTSYGSQTFLRGQTYDLPESTAIALGFIQAPVKTAEPELEELRLDELKVMAIEAGNDPEAVNAMRKKADVIEVIKEPVVVDESEEATNEKGDDETETGSDEETPDKSDEADDETGADADKSEEEKGDDETETEPRND
jgi:hypothetical protein